MMNLVIWHRAQNNLKNSPAGQALAGQVTEGGSVLSWGTCLRQIYFVDATFWEQLQEQNIPPQLAPGDELFQDGAAYRFLLEVLAGLRSPMVGETEVLGQFRQFLKLHEKHPLIQRDHSLWSSLLRDTKLVRETHLMNLGCHTYGSLVRKLVKPYVSATFLGAGQLVEEILPWVKSLEQVQVLSRSQSRMEALKQIRSDLQTGFLQEPPLQFGQAVLICAPMANERLWQLLDLLPENKKPEIVIDLRGEFHLPEKKYTFIYHNLTQFMSLIDQDKAGMQVKVQAAHAEIEVLVRQQEQRIVFRPMGWDDLCG